MKINKKMINLKHIKTFEIFESNDNDILNPKFTDKDAKEFLNRLGIDISSDVNVRKGVNQILYGFSSMDDRDIFKKYLDDNKIKYDEVESYGARYPYGITFIKN